MLVPLEGKHWPISELQVVEKRAAAAAAKLVTAPWDRRTEDLFLGFHATRERDDILLMEEIQSWYWEYPMFHRISYRFSSINSKMI